MLLDEQTVHLLKSVIRKNTYLDLPAEGTSMFPFIQEGDFCRFCQCDPLQLKKGDVVLFYMNIGQFIVHRFYERKVVGDKTLYVFKGDTNLGIDQPVFQENIIGKLHFIKKRKSIIYAYCFRASIWRNIIIHFPITSSILRKYINYKHRISY